MIDVVTSVDTVWHYLTYTLKLYVTLLLVALNFKPGGVDFTRN